VSDFSPAAGRALGEPLRLAMVGTVWNWGYARNTSLECLEQAWCGISERFPGAEVHYVGGSAELLPDGVKASVTNHGRRSPLECERILHGCHAALLPVSHPPGSIAQFSLPSRLADYLACGLPTIVSAEPSTAIHEFVAPLEGKCVANVQTPAELLSALESFCGSASAWRKAGGIAADFAARNLRVGPAQRELWAKLDGCRPLAARAGVKMQPKSPA
jgi:hypothetical protein